MGVNIRVFMVKSVDLTLPRGFQIEAFIKEQQNYTSSQRIRVESDLEHWSFNQRGEGFCLGGVVTEQGLKVTLINCQGEGSGHDFEELLIELFRRFKGSLEATVVWADGDIFSCSIVDGVVSRANSS